MLKQYKTDITIKHNNKKKRIKKQDKTEDIKKKKEV